MSIIDKAYEQALEYRPARNRNVKWLLLGVGVLLLLLVLGTFVTRATRIEAGHVGVEINLAGHQRGASDIPIRTGWVVYS